MKVAIVHYHLQPGGVSRVIRSAVQALETTGINHVILTGEDVPGLGYLSEPGEITAHSLLESLRAAATEALGAPPDIWHFHNHSLGKNRLIAEVVARLADGNERLVLQLHDLVEDGRPENYPLVADRQDLYPVNPRVRYVFLNSRALGLFIGHGLPAENAGVLPNPVSPPIRLAPPDDRPPLLLYPVRGIRRKNLGEFVLLSALVPPGTRLAVTRAPDNARWLPIHDSWQAFAARHQLPVEFAVVGRIAPDENSDASFESWLARATHLVTTSVSEGFGYTYLEGIAIGKPLIGRNIPHLARDHAENGLLSGTLYDRLLIPADLINADVLQNHVSTALEETYRLYQQPVPHGAVDEVMMNLDRGRHFGLANLPEALQQDAIASLLENSRLSEVLVQQNHRTIVANRWLAGSVANRIPAAPASRLSPYSIHVHRQQLVALYSGLLHQPAGRTTYIPPAPILASILKPEHFHFLTSPASDRRSSLGNLKSIIFDIYGTLLLAPSGGVKPDPAADPMLREIIFRHGCHPPVSPSTSLHAAVLRHHAASPQPHPEIDLRLLWRKILDLPEDSDTTALVIAIESAWHPASLMPGAAEMLGRLAETGVPLGLLSNAQCNTLPALGSLADLFATDLTLLSYEHLVAKPSPVLFGLLAEHLSERGILPNETLYIGNDPLNDIVPAAAAGFRTALFTGHPGSTRPGTCQPDFIVENWGEIF